MHGGIMDKLQVTSIAPRGEFVSTNEETHYPLYTRYYADYWEKRIEHKREWKFSRVRNAQKLEELEKAYQQFRETLDYVHEKIIHNDEETTA